MKELWDGTNREENIACSYNGKNSRMKISIVVKRVYRFNKNPINLPMVYFTRTRTNILTLCMKTKKTTNQSTAENCTHGGQKWYGFNRSRRY